MLTLPARTPAQRYLAEVDPEGTGLCVVGVRRAESDRRKFAPAYIPRSEHHGWRPVWHPLVEFSHEERDALVIEAGFEVLDHRSDECEPCIFSARADLRRVGADKVAVIREIEQDTGKTMFRAAAYAGASGIDEIMRWAWSERGKYLAPEAADGGSVGLDKDSSADGPEPEVDCESDFCGL